MTTTEISRAAPSRTRRAAVRAGVVGAAVLAAVAVWAIAVPVLDLDVTVPRGPTDPVHTELGAGPVIGAATMASLAGWALLAVLERFTRRARAIWTGVAVAVLVLTMPYAPGFTGLERVVLGLLHLTVAAVLIPGLRRTARPD